ncbi:MAG: hypothetical protein LUE14_12905 [Clostridiales bacterium]|nr:hypothetical protein [Clostridiales bacterium]
MARRTVTLDVKIDKDEAAVAAAKANYDAALDEMEKLVEKRKVYSPVNSKTPHQARFDD